MNNNMNILEIDINKLIFPKYNPRKKLKPEDKEYQKIKKSIEEFGYTDLVIINKDNTIISGNQRTQVLMDMGYKKIKVVQIDIDKTKEKALNIALNKITGEWDYAMLGDLLLDLDQQNYDLEITGFDIDEIEGIMAPLGIEEEKEVIEDDFDCTPPEEPKAKYGDIYQLGKHYLMCGDSTKEEDVAKLMNGVKADMVFTDPPYGMKKEIDGVANDNLNYDDLLEFNKKWIPITFNNLKDNGSWYCWGIDEPLMDIYSNILKPMAKENKITFRNLITWDKGSGQEQLNPEYKCYPMADEKCLFIMCGIQNLILNSENYWNGYDKIRNYLKGEANKVNLTPSLLKDICGVGMWGHWFTKSQFQIITKESYVKLQNFFYPKAFTKEYEELRAEYEELRAYFDNTHDNMNNVWHFSKTSGEERESAGGHATPKPIALCSRAIKSSSREKENVLDVFGGSGSTLIACEQNNRNAYLMELEPKWVDVIINRWETFTGKKAVKIEGEK